METARRLKEDQAELKALRQEYAEIEKAKKGNHVEEDIKDMRLAELEKGLADVTDHIEMGHVIIKKLEVENNLLMREMKDDRMKAMETEVRVEGELKWEKELGRMLVAKDGERSFIGEMLNSVRPKVVENDKWKNRLDQFKVLLSQVEKEKLKLEKQCTALREKREKGNALTEAEADNIKQKGQERTQKCKDEGKNTISELKVETDKMAIAMLNIGYGSNVSDDKQQFPKVTKRLPVFQEFCSSQNMDTEMECVMCMDEEVSVVFLPCVNQVLYIASNDIHEKKGMSDCPSCRAIIAHRVPVTYRAI